jgi:hypothetical protein
MAVLHSFPYVFKKKCILFLVTRNDLLIAEAIIISNSYIVVI